MFTSFTSILKTSAIINLSNLIKINIDNKLSKAKLSKLSKAQKLAKSELSFLITNTKKTFL